MIQCKLHTCVQGHEVTKWKRIFRDPLSARLKNPSTGKILPVLQRIAPSDLFGRLTEHKGHPWTVLALTAEFMAPMASNWPLVCAATPFFRSSCKSMSKRTELFKNRLKCQGTILNKVFNCSEPLTRYARMKPSLENMLA